jgi:hypothetical protein
MLRRTLLLLLGIGSATLNVHRALFVTDNAVYAESRFAALDEKIPRGATICFTSEPPTEQRRWYRAIAAYALIPHIVSESSVCEWRIGPNFNLEKAQ